MYIVQKDGVFVPRLHIGMNLDGGGGVKMNGGRCTLKPASPYSRENPCTLYTEFT